MIGVQIGTHTTKLHLDVKDREYSCFDVTPGRVPIVQVIDFIARGSEPDCTRMIAASHRRAVANLPTSAIRSYDGHEWLLRRAARQSPRAPNRGADDRHRPPPMRPAPQAGAAAPCE